ncbi:MAG TPA: C40 family peptidase [Ignavibacteria bacterium]|jgi:cell wall-associated NlpC family hydrolase
MQESRKLWLLFIIAIFSTVLITGCSSTLQVTDNVEGSSKKDVNGYKNSKELVSTNTLESKSTLNKGNLETLSSSLSEYVSSSEMTNEEMTMKIIEYLDTPYLWGGNSYRGIDCSAFVQSVMYQALGITLPRTSFEQSNVGMDVAKEDLKFGDLLFFDTMNKGRTTHVAIYIGNGMFAHSGSKTGVAFASLNSDYYSRTFLKSKRVIGVIQ